MKRRSKNRKKTDDDHNSGFELGALYSVSREPKQSINNKSISNTLTIPEREIQRLKLIKEFFHNDRNYTEENAIRLMKHAKKKIFKQTKFLTTTYVHKPDIINVDSFVMSSRV